MLRDNLIQLMREHNISQLQLAEELSIKQPTIHYIISGKTPNPKINTVQLIAKYFNMSIDDLVNTKYVRRIS